MRVTLSLASLVALPTAASLAYAQVDTLHPQLREVPGCAAAMCEEGAAFVAALDTLLRHEPSCGEEPPAVLRTIHLAPFTDVGDAVMGRRSARLGLPTSLAVLRIEDFGVNPFRRYWNAIKILDAVEVERGSVPQGACLFVFSPVTWMGEATVRVIVAESRERPAHIAQRFVFLQKRQQRWVVTRVETGMRS